MPDSFKVVRAFERHDGKALQKYARGRVITAKEAAKIPEKTWDRLVGSGCINRVVEDTIVRARSGDLQIGEVRDHSKLDLVISGAGEVR